MTVGSPANVVVTGGEHFGGLAAIRALADAGHRPWAAVVDPRGHAAWSRVPVEAVRVPNPASDQEAFAAGVAALAERVGANVVLPGTDVAIAALTRHLRLFPSRTALGLCSAEQIERATDKTALAELARVAGFAVPPTRISTRAELEAGDLPFPVVVKPVRSDIEGRHGELVHAHAQRAEDAAALRRLGQELEGDAWVVQSYVAGELVAVAGVAWEGTVVASIQQVAQRIWPADCGGSSYASTIEPDAERERRVAAIVHELQWSGIFQAQMLCAGDEEFLIDFNPRFYGTLELAVAAGVNLPALWVDLLLGIEPVPDPSYRVGVRFRAGSKDARALAWAAHEGSWKAALQGLLPRPNTCHPVFRWADPKPALAGAVRVVRKLAVSAGTRAADSEAASLDKTPGTS